MPWAGSFRASFSAKYFATLVSLTAENMMNMMETMLRNPEMQKMLYPYLPEPMRNPSSIEWMLSNPDVKKQMAQMFESQVKSWDHPQSSWSLVDDAQGPWGGCM